MVGFFFNITAQPENFDNFDVLNYNIEITIKRLSDKEITGKTGIKLVPVKEIKTINLDLLDFEINQIFVSGKEYKNFNYKNNKIKITFDKKMSQKDTLNISIFYKGKPGKDKRWGGFFFGDDYAFNIGVGMSADPQCFGRVWFPCHDNFTDKATYNYKITVPYPYVAVCSGVFQNRTDNETAETTTFIWKQNQEISTYLSSVAIAKYKELNLFHFGISKKIPISIYVTEDRLQKAEASFENLSKCISAYENSYGEYRWDRVGYVGVNFNSGAMEHACNIAYPNYAIDGTLKNETLYAHELAHSWFGNLVTCKTPSDMWLNEGWARFSEAVFTENIYGKEAYKNYIRNNHKKVLELAHVYDGEYLPVAGVSHEHTYSSTVYNKGADVVHTLRKYMGDSLFFATSKAYLDKFAYKSASTEDLKNFFSEYSGINLENFFKSWIYTAGFPHFSISNFEKDKNNIAKITIEQRLKARKLFSEDNKIELSFFSDTLGRFDTTVIFSGKEQIYNIKLPFESNNVFLDLDEKISDASISNYKIVDKSDMYIFENTNFRMHAGKPDKKSIVNCVYHYLGAGNTDFEISKEHYWTISGTSENFKGDALFYIDTKEQGIKLDVRKFKLYYRNSPKQKWESINFMLKARTDSRAYFVVENFKFGEYSVGK